MTDWHSTECVVQYNWHNCICGYDKRMALKRLNRISKELQELCSELADLINTSEKEDTQWN